MKAKVPKVVSEWCAVIGRKGGNVKSDAKSKAVRENARKPRKRLSLREQHDKIFKPE